MTHYNAIPTRYNGTLYRSRIEATWAHMFDQLRWPHRYEPIDLNGYIPDFILAFPHAPVLAEIKSDLYLQDMEKHHAKIESSGWEHEAILLGGHWYLSNSEWEPLWSFGDQWEEGGYDYETNQHVRSWSNAAITKCEKCGEWAFYNIIGSWHCRVNGCYDGDHYLGYVSTDEIDWMWKKAREATQWKR